MDLEKFASGINKCYGKPFLPTGFVKARVTKDGTLWLDIGDRNGEFNKDGFRIGADISVGEGKKWKIKTGGNYGDI